MGVASMLPHCLLIRLSIMVPIRIFPQTDTLTISNSDDIRKGVVTSPGNNEVPSSN